MMQSWAKPAPPGCKFYKLLTEKDTVPPTARRSINKNPLLKNDSLPTAKKDTSVKVQVKDTFDLKLSKDSLTAPIEFSATDSMVLDIPNKKIYLYNNASVKYNDIDLKAGKVEMDQQTQILVATYLKDTAGKKIGRPVFKQGDNATISDSLVFNSKTQKGVSVGSFTQQGEMFVHIEKSKKISPDVFYGKNNVFTGCIF